MAGQKETPRQKMISVMYLVLTAMLALNVSKEVLEGYAVVNKSLVHTNEQYPRKRTGAFAQLQREYELNKEEIGPFWDKAKVAMKLSSDMVKYITDLRDELIASTEKIPIEEARKIQFEQLRKKDDYTNATRFMIGSAETVSKSRARKLKVKLEEYREKMKTLISPRFKDKVKIGLETDGDFRDANNQKLSWEMHFFYDIPLGADVPILNKFIAEVNNAELEVINGLVHEMNADDFKYDRIEAKVLPNSTYLFPGETYKAEVIVAAYDTSHIPIPNVYYMMGVDSLPVSRKKDAKVVPRIGGKMNFEFPASTIGTQKYAGFVSMYNFSGKEHTYHFKGEFLVAQPAVAVSPTNMNVLYVGVQNPISLSATGVAAKDISAKMSVGDIKSLGDGKGWVAEVPPGHKEVTISVSASNGKETRLIGTEVFRVKNVPDPTPYLAGKKSGYLTRQRILDDGKIVARMPQDFEFNYTFQVVSFKLKMNRGFTDYEFKSKSGELTDEMKKEIARTNRGQILEFVDIEVKAPEGKTRYIEPLTVIISS